MITTTAASNTMLAWDGIPMVKMVVFSVSRISAPSTVPARLNRPPVSDVPPMTTARIASSSIHRPALLASAPARLELFHRPAMPAQTAQKMYTSRVMRMARTPASRAASRLPPTDSMSRPSAVRRVSSAARAMSAAARKTPVGTPIV